MSRHYCRRLPSAFGIVSLLLDQRAFSRWLERNKESFLGARCYLQNRSKESNLRKTTVSCLY
jgi:hypothetical protein